MREKKRFSRRILAWLLTTVLLMSSIPVINVFAWDNGMEFVKKDTPWSDYANSYAAYLTNRSIDGSDDYAGIVLKEVTPNGIINVKKGSDFQITLSCGKWVNTVSDAAGAPQTDNVSWHWGSNSTDYCITSADGTKNPGNTPWKAYLDGNSSKEIQSGIDGEFATGDSLNKFRATSGEGGTNEAYGIFKFTPSSFSQLNTPGVYTIRLAPTIALNNYKMNGFLSWNWNTIYGWGHFEYDKTDWDNRTIKVTVIVHDDDVKNPHDNSNVNVPFSVSDVNNKQVEIFNADKFQTVTTGVAKNLVYASQGRQSMYSNKGYINWNIHRGGPYVMVYDGVTQPQVPIVLEVHWEDNSRANNVVARWCTLTATHSFALAGNWVGGNNGVWDDNVVWDRITDTNKQVSIDPNNYEFSTSGSRNNRFFFRNAMKYTGNFTTAGNGVYYEKYSTHKMYVGSSYGNQTAEFDTNTSVEYVLNYKPVYDIITGRSKVTVDGKQYTFKELYSYVVNNIDKFSQESLTEYFTAVERVMNLNLNEFFNGADDGNVEQKVKEAAEALRLAATYDTVASNLKRQYKVTFTNKDNNEVQKNYYVGTFTPNKPSSNSAPSFLNESSHYIYSWPQVPASITNEDKDFREQDTPESHSITSGEDTPPTSDTVGISGGTRCDKCDTDLTHPEIIPMTGHSSVYESGLNTVISGKYPFVGVTNTPPSEADMVKTAPQTENLTAEGRYGTITVAGGKAKYKVSTMSVEGTDTFWLVAKVTDPVECYVYEKVTIVPSKTLYFEDSFTQNGITYENGKCSDDSTKYGQWSVVGTETNVSEIELSNDYPSSATYSMGAAHKVQVSDLNSGNGNKNWPKLSFTFAGTGFDLISHTSSASGMFAVKVYDSDGNQVKSKIIDTYRGYSYRQLFYDEMNKKITADNNASPLYVCDEASAVVSSNGRFFTTVENDTPAMGWLESKSGSQAMYQVPVLSIKDLGYGLYTVTVEARFTQAYGHFDTDGDGNKFYELTVDALRIHNPAGEVDEVKALHDKIEITEIRDIALGADTKYDSDVTAGFYILDGNKKITNQELGETFFKVSPNNELYLASGQSITFELNTDGYSDILLGMRAPTGAPSRVTLTYNNKSADIDVTSASEIYRSLEKDLGASGLVTVTNNGEGILSLTNVMTIKEEGGSAAKAPLLVSSRTIPNAVAMLNVLKSDLSIDEESIEKTAGEDGKVTISVTTGKDISSLIVRDENGNEITPDEINSVTDGEKLNWTVTLTESESGKYTYTLQGVHESGFTNGEVLTVSLEIEIRSEEPGEEPGENPGEEPGEEPSGEPEEEPSDENTTEQKLTLWEKLLEIVKHILTIIFGIKF